MYLRPQVSLPVTIALIALYSLPVAYSAVFWNRGESAFRQRHAQLASDYRLLGRRYVFSELVLQAHIVKGHSCQGCRKTSRPANAMLDEVRRKKEILKLQIAPLVDRKSRAPVGLVTNERDGDPL